MKIIKAINFGILLWMLIFLEVSILKFGFNIQETSWTYYYIHIPLLVLFTLMSGLSYFWGSRTKRGFLEGLILALVFIAVLFLLDLFITVMAFTKDYSLLIRPDILIGELIVFVITIIVGVAKK